MRDTADLSLQVLHDDWSRACHLIKCCALIGRELLWAKPLPSTDYFYEGFLGTKEHDPCFREHGKLSKLKYFCQDHCSQNHIYDHLSTTDITGPLAGFF